LVIAKGKTVCSKCLNEGRCGAGDKGVFIFIDPLLLTVNRLPISVAGPNRHHPSCSKLFRMKLRSFQRASGVPNALCEEEHIHQGSVETTRNRPFRA
jgi:hypothetical protein